MSKAEQHQDIIHKLSREDIAPSWWVGKALNAVDRDYPPTDVRSHPTWARVWDRPMASTWDSAASVDRAAEEWDAADQRNSAVDEWRKERETTQAEQQREKDAAETAQREADTAALKQTLKARYMALPGTTESDFERDLPQLLQDERRHQLDQREQADEQARQAIRRTVLSNF